MHREQRRRRLLSILLCILMILGPVAGTAGVSTSVGSATDVVEGATGGDGDPPFAGDDPRLNHAADDTGQVGGTASAAGTTTATDSFDESLVSYFRLDTGNGEDIIDAVDGQEAGVAEGSVNLSVPGLDGTPSAARFAPPDGGAFNRIDIETDIDYNTTDEFTWSAWVEPNAHDGGYFTILTRGALDFWIYNGSLRVDYDSTGATRNTISHPVSPGRKFVTLTYDHVNRTHARFSFSVDGEPVYSEIGPDISLDAYQSMYIGGYRDVSLRKFGGVVDEVRVYDRALSGMEAVNPANQEPTAELTAETACLGTNETVAFDAGGSSDPDGDVETYRWLVDGEQIEGGEELTTSFGTAGQHRVTVSVVDDDGESDTTATSVYVSPPDQSGFSFTPVDPLVGDVVTFTACDRGDATYEWAFGDGSSAIGPNVSHTYDAPGEYNVTLTVNDTETVDRTVTVTTGDVEVRSVEPQKGIIGIAGYPVEEVYRANVTATNTRVSHVNFTLHGVKSTTDVDNGDGFDVTVDFRDLAVPTYLTVRAVGEDGSTDTIRRFVPVYTSQAGVLRAFLDQCRDFGGQCTGQTIEYSVGVDASGLDRLDSILGDRSLGIEAGAAFSLDELALSGSGGGTLASPFPSELIDRTPLPADAEFSASLSFTGGAGLEPAANYTLRVDQRPLEYAFGIEASTSADVPTPASVPLVGGVEVALNASAGVEAEGQVRNETISGPLDPTLEKGTVTASGRAAPQLGAVVCDASVGPEASVGLGYRTADEDFFGTAALDVVGVVECPLTSRSVSVTIAEVTYPRSSSSSVVAPTAGTGGDWTARQKGGTGPGTSTDDATLALTSDSTVTSSTNLTVSGSVTRLTADNLTDSSPALAGQAGSYTVAWDRQDANKSVADGRDVFLATDDGSGWSANRHLTDDTRLDVDPDVALTGDGGFAVWARANRTFSESEVENFSDPTPVLSSLEIAVANRSDGSWSAPRLLTDDAGLDTAPAVVAGDGRYLLTWFRDADGNVSTDGDRSFAYAVYEQGSLSAVRSRDADAVATSRTGNASGFRLAYADGRNVTVGSVDATGALTPTANYTVGATEPNVSSLAVGPNRTAWIAGTGADQTLQAVGANGSVRTLATGSNVTGLTDLSLQSGTGGDPVVLTYRGRTPGTNGSTVFYRLHRGGTWVGDRALASGVGANLTVRDASTAFAGDGFRGVSLVEPVAGPDSSTQPRSDLFALRHGYAPDYQLSASATPDRAPPGADVSVSYSLANSGDEATTSNVTVTLSNASGVVTSTTHGPLDAGERVDGTLNGTADASGTLTVRVDPSNATAELSEANNDVTLRTGRSDLRVRGIETTRHGDTVTVAAAIDNAGNATADAGQYVLENASGTVASTAVADLLPGRERTVTLDVAVETLANAGLLAARVTAAADRDTSNNARRVRLGRPDVEVREAGVGFVDTTAGIRAAIPVGNAGPVPATTTVSVQHNGTTLGNATVELNGTDDGTTRFETVSVTIPDGVAGREVGVRTDGPYLDGDPGDDGFATTVAPVVRPAASPGALAPRWSDGLGARLQYARLEAADGRVYAAGLGRNVTAYDATTGKVVWRTQRAGSLVDSAPTVAGETVYVGSGSGRVYALEAATGDPRWTVETGSAVSVAPTVADGRVYVGTNDGQVVALGTDGTHRWTRSVGEFVSAAPTVVGGTVYVTVANGTVLALEAGTGARRWTREFAGGFEGEGVAVGNGTVVAAPGKVVGLNGSTGEVVWERGHADTSGATPAVAGGTAYVGDGNGTVSAIDVGNGSVVWSRDFQGRVRAPAAVVGATVYVGTTNGTVAAVDRGDGSVLASMSVPGRVSALPVADGDGVYVGTWGGSVVAIGVE